MYYFSIKIPAIENLTWAFIVSCGEVDKLRNLIVTLTELSVLLLNVNYVTVIDYPCTYQITTRRKF